MPELVLSGAILAGGRSSRMGRDKAFLPVEGTTLVAFQAAKLRALGIDDLLISGRVGTDYSVDGAQIVYDSVTEAGPLAGLAAVLAATRHPWVLVLAVDLPKLSVAYLQKLIATSDGGQCGVVPKSARGYEPLAALYPRTLLVEIEAALAVGQFALQPLLARAEVAGSMRALRITEEDAREFANWNTPALP